MKNKNFKRIILIIFLIILLISSTYAWFTVNKLVTVDNLNVQVKSVGSIEISVNAIDWKAGITKEELLTHEKYETAINQIPDYIFPVSTIGNITDGKMEMFYGSVGVDENSDFILRASKEEEKDGIDGMYMAFDIFLKVQRDTTLYIKPTTQVKSVSLTNKERSTGIENAVRIGIINYGTSGLEVEPSITQSLNIQKESYIIEPNCDNHTLASIKNAENIYNVKELTDGTGNRILKYYGIKEAIEDGVFLTSTDEKYFSEVNTIPLTTSFFNGKTATKLTDLQPGITKLRVYIWIEGQDIDCENYATGANILVNLQLGSQEVE